MELRNKKTGIRGYIEYVMRTINPITREPLLTVRYKDDSGITCYKDYETIEEFNEEWEDYKPAEPVIEDKKVRKFVLDWAKYWGVKEVVIRYIDKNRLNLIGFPDLTTGTGLEIDIPRASARLYLGDCKRYTIPELCGEEVE